MMPRDLGQKRVKLEENSGFDAKESQIKVEFVEVPKAETPINVEEKEEEPDDDEDFVFEEGLFPILTDDELDKLIYEWKTTNQLWTLSVPSLRTSSVGHD